MAGETSTNGSGIVLNYNNGSAVSVVYENSNIFPDYLVPFGSGVRPTGLSFLKWNTASDGSGIDGIVGETIPAADLENHTVYYAQWSTVPMIINKGRIEDIADAVRLKNQGSQAYTKFDLDDLPAAITSLKTNAAIGIKTQLTGHRRLYGTSTSTNTLTLATGLSSTKVYIGMMRWTNSSSYNTSDLNPTVFVIADNTISFPLSRTNWGHNDISLSLTRGVLKLTRATNTGSADDIYLIGLSEYGAYSQYNTTAEVFRLYEAQTV